ncbi:MAG: sulfite reductase subunit alpha [Verrucomicrobiales bacterium]|nr:sulfite reductase subunit alpha [Verrucomicrobiales bacterium]
MAIAIPEIPNDAPLDESQRAWLKNWLAGALAGGDSDKFGKPRVLILFGSESGNAQALSEGFSEQLKTNGWSTDVVDMEEFAKVDLSREHLLLVVTSTWGEGDPPENAVAFWEAFQKDDFPRVEGLKFSVLALGDTNYADFCAMGKNFDARLEELGGERFAPRVDCDVDYEDPAEEWFRVVCSKLDEMEFDDVAVAQAQSAAVATTDETSAEPAQAGPPYTRKNPFPAPLLKNVRLNKEGAFKDTRHLELSLANSELEYEVGDVLGVFPHNDPDLIDEMLPLLPFNTTVSVDGHDGRHLPLRDALIELYDVRTIAKSTIKKWAALCSHPWLQAILDDSDAVAQLIDGREIIDLLIDFPADFKSAQDFVGILRKLNPRLYSIASSLKAHPEEVHLTVAKVEYDRHGRHRKGVASCFICDRVPEGGTMGVFLQHAKHFKLPEDLDRDIIMVGPGTGIAPFRAFLEERNATGASGRNWLFFGNPYEATDYFYQEEFEQMQADGVLNRIDLAWSRDQEHKIYVQHKMNDAAAELWEWVDGGAHLYVCGDAQYMAGDVDKALHDLIEKHGGRSETEAAEYVDQMKKDKRYQRDVY